MRKKKWVSDVLKIASEDREILDALRNDEL